MNHKNKRGWATKDLFTAFIVATSIIGLMMLVATQLAIDYDQESLIDTTSSSRYDKSGDINNTISVIYNQTASSQGLEPISSEISIFSAFGAIRDAIMRDIPALFNTISNNFAEDYGIPSAVINLIFGIAIMVIVVGIVILIINWVRGVRPL